MSLQEFIKTNHDRLVSMTREKVAKRGVEPRPNKREAHGVPIFLEQVCEALVAEAKRGQAHKAEPDPPTNPNAAESAALYGHDVLRLPRAPAPPIGERERAGPPHAATP